jgi:hypothetical protein
MFSKEAGYINFIVFGLFLPVLKSIYHIRVYSQVAESMRAGKSFLGDVLSIFVGLTHGNILSTQERTVQNITIRRDKKHLLNITLLINDITSRFKSPLQKFYGRHHDLVDRYKISIYGIKWKWIFSFLRKLFLSSIIDKACRLFSPGIPVCSTK